MTSAPKLVNVHITLKTVAQAAAFLLLLALLYVLRDLVLIILVSVVIASAIEPATLWFSRYKVPRVLAVIFVYLVTLGIIFSLVPFLIFYTLGDLTELLSSLSQKFSSWLPTAESAPPAWSTLSALLPGFSPSDVFSGLRGILNKVQGGFLGAANLIFGGLFSFVMIVIISFYLSVQERGVENFLRLIVPLGIENYVVGLWQRSQRKIGRWLQGQLILALLVGILVYLGLTILGVKYALALAAIATILELIPIFGPILAAIPAVLVALTESWTAAVMVVGFYIIVQQFENHLLHPLVVKKIIGVPPIIVIIALFAGAKLAGFLGLILAAPVAAVLMEILSDWEKKKSGYLQTKSP